MLPGVSRGEDLLIGIERLLADGDVGRDAIDMIAVSVGPGSFTGIRIGIATALGLCSSLEIMCVGVNAFEAISMSFPHKDMIIALPLGRGYFALQEVSLNGLAGGAHVAHEEELIQCLNDRSDIKLVSYSGSGSSGVQLETTENIMVCTEPLSTLVGQYALAGGGSQNMSPIYLRNQGSAGVFADRRSA